MQENLSPRKYGLTATLPSKTKQKIINEGLFGPVIASLSVEKGIELGIISTPDVNLIPVPYEPGINQNCKTFKEYYEKGIVENKTRNQLIKNAIDPKEITLIIVERTEHGKVLQKMLSSKGRQVPFIYGSTAKDKRNRAKGALKQGSLKLAICSRVWKEGTNIPSLNHIINACGMKDEKGVLQAIGRGLRTTRSKTTVKISDFLDPYKYLAEHSIQRVSIYAQNDWV